MIVFRTWLVSLLFSALSISVKAGEPEWRFPDFPSRAVFIRSHAEGNYALVKVPVPDTGDTTLFVATDSAGASLPFRLVTAASNEASVLIEIKDQKEQRIALYYGGTNAGIGQVSNSLTDPLPVAVDVHKSEGQGIPNSWAKMLYLYGNSEESDTLLGADFENPMLVPASKENHRHGRRGRRERGEGQRLMRLYSVALAARPGKYKFALDCKDAGFLFVDGEMAASWPGEHEQGQWMAGEELILNAGPHVLEVYSYCKNEVLLKVGWRTPDSQSIVPIGRSALLTAAMVSDVRIERMGRTIQPDFSCEIMPAYAIRCSRSSTGRIQDGAAVFVPVRFKNTTENWITSKMKSHWSFGDGSESTDKTVIHVYARQEHHRAVLNVRDSLGFAGSCERVVDCGSSLPREYVVAAELILLPPVCYESDVIEPTISISGRLPDKVKLQAVWDIEDRSGNVKTSSRAVELSGEAVLSPLVRTNAGSIAQIKWRVEHQAVPLKSGTVRFVSSPFPELPVRVEGDRLYGRYGTQLVLLPYRKAGSFCQPAIPRGKAPAKLVCIGDMIAGQGASSNKTDAGFEQEATTKFLKAPAWEESPGGYGPLLKLVDVPAAIGAGNGADVVILNFGLKDILELRDPDAFERQIAALSDIVSATMKCPVLWVTPPPYPPDPVCVRPYAAAITRVADVRGMPVADIYTAFMCSGDGSRLFVHGRNLEMSESGRRLGEQTIVRAFRAWQKGNWR
jgi:hypothetical protein